MRVVFNVQNAVVRIQLQQTNSVIIHMLSIARPAASRHFDGGQSTAEGDALCLQTRHRSVTRPNGGLDHLAGISRRFAFVGRA